jgi:hypothetical protein
MWGFVRIAAVLLLFVGLAYFAGRFLQTFGSQARTNGQVVFGAVAAACVVGIPWALNRGGP